MRILQVVHDFLPIHMAGTEVYTHDLSVALRARGHEVGVFCWEDGPETQNHQLTREVFHDLTVYRVLKPKKSIELLSYNDAVVEQRFREVLDEFEPELVHFQHLLNLSLGLPAISNARGIKNVMTLPDYWYLCPWGQLIPGQFDDRHCCDLNFSLCKEFNSDQCAACTSPPIPPLVRMWLVRIIMARPQARTIRYLARRGMSYARHPAMVSKRLRRMASKLEPTITPGVIHERFEAVKEMFTNLDLVISPSRFLKSMYEQFGIRPKQFVYSDYGMNLFEPGIDRSGVDGTGLPGENQTPQEILKFGFIGMPVRHKGVHVLIEAFNAIRSGATLHLFGNFGLDRAYSARVRRMIDNPAIIIRGPFDNARIAEILAELDALIIPSIWYENSPLTIHEAFIAGVPVVTSDIGGMAELVEHDKTGLLFKVGDPRDLRAALQLLISEPARLDRYRQNIAAIRIKSTQENAGEIEEIYRELLGS